MSPSDKIDHALTILKSAEAHGPAVHTNSFGAEGVVLSHLISRYTLEIETASLDTGRLPEQTYAVADALRQRYGLRIDWYFPDPQILGDFTQAHGVNAFYNSTELRHACCGIRKVEPLGRALVGKLAWITGRRRQQGHDRAVLPEREWDEQRGILKFNPLAEWTHDDVWAFIRINEIPYSSLHDQGYPSIGCAPCSRAITVGEEPRAGRWWWEHDAVRECGLHGPARPAAEDQALATPIPPIPDVGL